MKMRDIMTLVETLDIDSLYNIKDGDQDGDEGHIGFLLSARAFYVYGRRIAGRYEQVKNMIAAEGYGVVELKLSELTHDIAQQFKSLSHEVVPIITIDVPINGAKAQKAFLNSMIITCYREGRSLCVYSEQALPKVFQDKLAYLNVNKD